MIKQAVIALTALFFLTAISLAQEGRYQVAVSGGSVFTKQAEGNGITQGATIGSNIIATGRIRFNQKHSLAFNYGHARNSQTYQESADFHVLETISEFSGAYIFNPFQKGRWQPFVLAGVGALVFSPSSTWVFLPEVNNEPNNVQTNVGAKQQTEVGFLYGFGVDYQIPRVSHFALRLQYRGFLYRNPDFGVNPARSTENFFTDTRGHMAGPAIGLVFCF